MANSIITPEMLSAIAKELPTKPSLFDSILCTSDGMENLRESFDRTSLYGQSAMELSPTIYGMRVETVNTFIADQIVPVRRHNPEANGGKASYHRRIQKKWNKRFGMKKFMEDTEYLMFDRSYLTDFLRPKMSLFETNESGEGA